MEEGVGQMSTLVKKSYLVKVSRKGQGVKNILNFDDVVCTCPHTQIFLENPEKNVNKLVKQQEYHRNSSPEDLFDCRVYSPEHNGLFL